MRIFVALLISKQLRDIISDWRKSHHELPVRWVKPENLHITLVPPWQEKDIEKIKNKLIRLEGKFGPIELTFEKVEFGPHKEEPKFIWAAGNAPKKLLELNAIIKQTLNISENTRPFYLHLTLARFKSHDFARFRIKKLDEQVCWQNIVDFVVLMESQLKLEGVEYKFLQEVRL